MRRIWLFLTDSRNLTIAGFIATAALCYLGAELLELALIWAVAALAAAVLAWLLARWLKRRKTARATVGLEAARAPAEAQVQDVGAGRQEVDAVRSGMLKAIATIKGSKLGRMPGSRALYQLPWYMVIGNPSAGKSSAIINSGLQFPFADARAVHGAGGTRNCDWFFTADGIVLDTAGRYAVEDEHLDEWRGFLDLLKKHRKRAPVNGIIVAVSVAELRSDPDGALRLARSLRKRVQDLIERLEVFAPVYVLFTKADLIAGFSDFFCQGESSERERVWGATMPYKRRAGSQELLAFFDQGFDELHTGLVDMGMANMAQPRRTRMAPGIFTFPMEFASMRAPLRAFLATLFEENPFQFQPVFRGFYFSSALQEGQPLSAQSQRIAERYELALGPARQEVAAMPYGSAGGYFLFKLFRDVVFADKALVSQYASRASARLRYAAFFGAVVLLGGALGGWTWSYMGNRQLAANVQADLDKVAKLQEGRVDLQPRLEALEILQDRIEQLEKFARERPWAISMGLYQGGLLERKLRQEYYAGVKEVMVMPVAARLEALLFEMNANAEQLAAPVGAGQPAAAPAPAAVAAAPAASRQYADADPLNVDDAYNALKTYLMLADPPRAEAGHLNDQLTRYWRGWLEANRGAMPREQMIRSAERLLTFYLAQSGDPSWPRIEQKLALVDQARENLRRVVRGTPARDRVYADIRARAGTRFPAMTVVRIVGEQDQALMAGSHAVPGAFTREAWEKYIQGAIREAASGELQSTDWVLRTASKDDLTLAGSPEQIEKHLVEMYKSDFSRAWQKFVQGVAVTDLDGFNGAVAAMNRLGDPQSSPIVKVLNTINEQTSWDNPTLANAEARKAQRGFTEWVEHTLLRRAPAPVTVPLDPARFERPMGTVGRAFAAVARLVSARDKNATLLRGYMEALSRLRTRLNTLKNQGDPGPGARLFMQQTLEGTGSELADALRFVDEQMLTGMGDEQKLAIRPLLVRPLMQTFAVIIGPAEADLNQTWLAQVYQPFQRTLAAKYPFSPDAKIEASSLEIAQFFGPDGLVAKFVTTAMGPLVVRRGDALAPRTWADMGIALSPQAVSRFPGWIAPLGAGGVGAASAAAQTVFQIQPLPAPGTLEYTVEIDGQQLRYRNTPAQWTGMVHPGPQGIPGARITAVAFDGRSVELFNEPGQFGLKRMIDAAVRMRKEEGVHELRWTNAGISVALDLKITSSPEAGNGAAPQEQGMRGMTLPESIVGTASAVAAPAALAALPQGGAR
ncbi:type VI secretion protein VasK [Massilia sp. Root351]|uniref:type VI secretion system membrane subunit TssM n=1 Tax=Massilia sp. Root351 TaxID=1736522 RepID=UPI00070968DB|nr:type VI secretion system membrane subunit TssM [Massilia sp. Root351]KQV85041.1 type VI secretion protein VasK [Massilia sp. Root351]